MSSIKPRYILSGAAAIAVPAALLCALYPDRAVGHVRRSDIPQPPADPIVGHLRGMLLGGPELYHYFLRCHEQVGPIYTLTMPLSARIIVVSDPDILQHILKTNFDNYVKGVDYHERMVQVFGNGIFNADGAHWHYQRKTAANLFNVRNFRDHMTAVFLEQHAIIDGVIEDAIDTQTPIDLQDLFFRFTFDSFGRIGFGVDFGASTVKDKVPFAAAFDAAQHTVALRFNNPLWKYTEMLDTLRTWKRDPLKEHVDVIDEVVHGIIADRRADPSASEKSDLLSLFMRTCDENGQLPDDKQLRDVVLNFIVAGRDTTAQALSWTFYELAKHPEIEQELYEESLTLDPELSHQEMFEAVKHLRFTHAVFNETLRLHPSVPANMKEALQDDVLPDGTRIEAGELVIWSAWAMGRLESLWGPDAKQWRPHRWLEPSFQKPSAFKWPAFHAGPRTCLGQNMATLEAITCLALLIRKFKFTWQGDRSSEAMYARSVTLPMLEPLMMRIERR